MGWKDAPLVDETKAKPSVEVPSEPKWKSAPLKEEESGAVGFMQHLNRGISSTLGAPVDLANAALEFTGVNSVLRKVDEHLPKVPIDGPFLGSQSFEQGMRKSGEALGSKIVPDKGQEASSFGEHVAEGAGEAVGALVPVGAAAQLAAKFGGATASAIGGSMLETTASKPVATIAMETIGGAGAGAGKYAAKQHTDNEALHFLAELAGGMTAGAVVNAAGKTPAQLAYRAAKAAAVPFTEAGGKVRASNRLRSLVADPEAAARKLDEDTVGGLSPAQQTGESRLMELEHGVRAENPEVDKTMGEAGQLATGKLSDALKEPGDGVPAGAARKFVSDRLKTVLDALDARMKGAQEKARQRLEALEPDQLKSEASAIVREELEKAVRDARAEESRLWTEIPDDVSVETSPLLDAFEAVVQSTPRTQRDDIPQVATRFLNRESNERLSDQETLKELMGLRSNLLGVVRQARSEGNFNKARLADEIAEAVLENIHNAQSGDIDVSAAIDEARAFSAHLNQTFKQGNVGRLLGKTRHGGDAVPHEVTLDTTVGRGGMPAVVAEREIAEAVGNSPGKTQESIKQYLSRRFLEFSMSQDELNPKRGRKFLENNSELLSRYPDLQQAMTDSIVTQEKSLRVGRTSNSLRTTLESPSKSHTAEFLGANIDEEVAKIIRSQDPVSLARQIRRQVSKDKTGQAIKGLKSAFSDFLISQHRSVDADGNEVFRGGAMIDILRDGKFLKAAEQIFNPGEMNRLRRIAVELSQLEKSRAAAGKPAAVMDDLPNSMLSYMFRVMGARMGAQAGAGTSGASLMTAQLASQRVKRLLYNLTNDKASQIISDAVQDKELFKTLLLGVSAPRNRAKVNQRMNAWLVGPGARYLESLEGEEEQLPPAPSSLKELLDDDRPLMEIREDIH